MAVRRAAPVAMTERTEDPRRRLRPSPELEDEGPDGDEHRRFPRAKADVRFDVLIGDEDAPRFRAAFQSDNISVSGAFLRSTFFLPVGTQLNVSFKLEGNKEQINARAEVVREEREGAGGGRSGMGIRFLEFDEQSEVALARLFLAPRLRTFVESYLKTKRAKKIQGEVERVVDALAAWELMQVTQPEDPWRPQGED